MKLRVFPRNNFTLLFAVFGKEGILLRNYKVDNLWNLKPGEERMSGYFDGTPEWFDDGVFSFTDDGAAPVDFDAQAVFVLHPPRKLDGDVDVRLFI